MTDLTPAGQDTLARLTEIPFEIWAVAIVLVIVGTIAAAIVKAPLDNDAPPSRLDLMDQGHCGSTYGALVCDRPAGHEGAHVDPFHGTQYGPSRWTDGRAA